MAVETHHDLMPELLAAASPAAVSYGEVRAWAYWLRIFTASDLADAMGVTTELGDRGVRALLWHGIAEDTGDWVGGERIIQMLPLPPGPRVHETQAPEWRRWPAYSDIIQPRGIVVRIRTQRDLRGGMSTPGSRQKLKNRERAYQRQVEAQEKRREEQLKKAMEDPKWKRVSRGPKRRDRTIDTRTGMGE